jgi:hypothetical protein
MIETPLRSVINMGFWKTMLIPVYSAKLFVDPVNAVFYSLCVTIPGLVRG